MHLEKHNSHESEDEREIQCRTSDNGFFYHHDDLQTEWVRTEHPRGEWDRTYGSGKVYQHNRLDAFVGKVEGAKPIWIASLCAVIQC